MRTKPGLILVLILITAAFVSAQERPPTGRVFTDSVRVDIVNVEVFVVDTKGRPVYELEREDFELLVKGELVEISNFYAPPVPAEDRTEPRPVALEKVKVEAPPHHIVVFVDHTNLLPARRHAVMASLRALIEDRLAEGNRIMIADYDARVEVLSHFGDDPDVHLAALGTIDRTGASTFQTHTDFNRILRCIEVGCSSPSAIWNDIEVYAKHLRHRNRIVLAHLATVIESMAGLPGRRSLLIVSDGIAARPGEALFAVFMNRFSRQDGGVHARLEAGRYAVNREIEQTTDLANARRVTLYALNNGGIVGNSLSMMNSAANATQIVDQEIAFIHEANYTSSMQQFALNTGGRVIFKPTDETLEEVRQDFDTSYSLGFVPDHEPDNKSRNIKVRVLRDGVRVRYRDNYTLTTDEGSAAVRTKMAMILGEEANPLRISVDFLPDAARTRNRWVVQTAIRIPIGALAMIPAGNDVYQGRLEFTFYLEDEKGATTPIQETELPLELPGEVVTSTTPNHITYDLGFKVRQGNHRLALSVTDPLGSATSTLTWGLTVDGEGRVIVTDR